MYMYLLGQMLTYHHFTACNQTVLNFLTRFSPYSIWSC